MTRVALLLLLILPSTTNAQDEPPEINVNERYTVESVEISGIEDTRVPQRLRNRLQALVGSPLDASEAERVSDALAAELPGHDVTRRILRGSQQGRIRVVFDVSEVDAPRWIRSPASRSKFVYHGDQGWSGVLDMSFGGRRSSHRATVGLAFDNGDDAVEEYSGFRFGLASRRLGTRRLGAGIEVSLLRQSWRDETLAALAADPSIPEPYRASIAVDPSVTFALTPELRLTGGVSVTRLESLSRSPETRMASAAVAGVAFNREPAAASGDRHRVAAEYQARIGTDALASDLTYRRHAAAARYRFEHRNSTILASAGVGYLTGAAPLFERFTLGDSSTLRGWNKYDIAPAGGDRMVHGSVEYRYHWVALFVDTGSAWDAGQDRRMRLSTGFGLHGDHAFLTLGFPLNSDEAAAAFTMGVRF